MKELLILVLLTFSLGKGWWPFEEEEKEEKQETTKHVIDPRKQNVVPFEVTVADQKFLLEAKQMLEMTELDFCQHEIISELQKSCSDMSEEEIAKMSVRLLNCQSETEGREVFSCTDDMSVAECTKSMDPHMWNAYHIVSNRARSVCYATRQKQFRYQTESAVNTLTHSTIQQIKIMEGFASSHQQLHKRTNESLEYLKVEQEFLLQKQESLSSSQDMLKNSIKHNLHQLAEERHLVKMSNAILKNMTEQLKKQIELTQTVILQQEESRQQHQDKLNEDIERLSENIQKVWLRIDNSTDQLLHLLTHMTLQYETTLHNLNTINDTVLHVLTLLDTMNSAINIQLAWLLDKLGGAEDGLRALTTIISHVMFLLLSCLVLLFLRAPWLSRTFLLVLVLVNAGSEVHYNISLSLTQLTAIMVTVLLVEWCYLWCNPGQKYLTQAPPKSISQAPPINQALPTDPPLQSNTVTMDTVTMDTSLDDEVLNISGYMDVPPSPYKSHDMLPKSHDRLRDRFSMSRESTPLTDTPTKCVGMTRNGMKCRLRVLPGSRYCRLHC